MDTFSSHPDFDGHKFVSFIHDNETGLRGFIAVHDDVLGPALGGTRMFLYASEEEALTDVLRLSRGMTHKAALAGLSYGGGKAVLIGDPKTDKTEAYLRAYGRRVNYLGGKFITAEDVGISVADIETIAKEALYVVGRSEGMHEGKRGSGDPSPITALGVLYGIQACLEVVFGHRGVAGHSFAIQGLGKVGRRLARLIHEQRGQLIVADVDELAVRTALAEFTGCCAVPTAEIHKQNVDVFVPCAMGGILNPKTIPELRCRIVAGAANNQLATAQDGTSLFELEILYAPDYVINAGGLINVTDELEAGGYDDARAKRKVSKIYGTLQHIFQRSKEDSIPPCSVSEEMAREILAHARNLEKLRRNVRNA